MRQKLRRYRRTTMNKALRPWSPWLELDVAEIDATLAVRHR